MNHCSVPVTLSLSSEKWPTWYGRKADSCVKRHMLTPVQSHHQADYSPKINSSARCKSALHPPCICSRATVLTDVSYLAFLTFTLLSPSSIFNKVPHLEPQMCHDTIETSDYYYYLIYHEVCFSIFAAVCWISQNQKRSFIGVLILQTKINRCCLSSAAEQVCLLVFLLVFFVLFSFSVAFSSEILVSPHVLFCCFVL